MWCLYLAGARDFELERYTGGNLGAGNATLTYLLTYLLNHSTVQSRSWAADWFAASQEIPPNFMELEGSLPHSQTSDICPYPGPA